MYVILNVQWNDALEIGGHADGSTGSVVKYFHVAIKQTLASIYTKSWPYSFDDVVCVDGCK